MLPQLLLLFTLLPLAELVILLWIGHLTSIWTTILLVLGTGIIGALLARLEGWRTLRRIQEELRNGRMPGDAVMDALLILIAGALLVTPGILTDLFGFALLIPAFRGWMKTKLKRRFARRFHVMRAGPTTDQSEVVEARIVTEETDRRDEA